MPVLTDAERRYIARKFALTVYFLSHMEIFWLPSKRRIIARSINAKRRFRVPEEAILIGIYTYPFTPADFVGDLEDALVKRARQHPAEARSDDDDEALAPI